MEKSGKALISRSNIFDEGTEEKQESSDMDGVGFVTNKGPYHEVKYVYSEEQLVSKRTAPNYLRRNSMSRPMSQHQDYRDKNQMRKRFKKWRCYHCGRFGYIKPFCFKLYGYPTQTSQVQLNPETSAKKQE